jgi:predicted permease
MTSGMLKPAEFDRRDGEMGWLSRFLEQRKNDLEAEMRAHIEMDIADRVSRGEAPDHARFAARRAFGNSAIVQDVTHDVWRWTRLERFFNLLKFAVRGLKRSPGFTFTVVLTLSIGVGATCAMFTVVDRVLLRPVRFNDPSRLVLLSESGKRGPANGTPYLDIAQWQQRSRSFEQISFYEADSRRVWFLDGSSGTVHVSMASTSASLFPMLGVQPALGRGFLETGSGGLVAPEDAHAIILSDDVWRQDYGSDSAAIGKTIQLDGEPLTIIGVMPRGFIFPFGSGEWNDLPVVWRPIVLSESDATRDRHAPHYKVLARIKQNTPMSLAEPELKVIQADVAKAYTDPYDREQVTSVSVESYSNSLVNGNMRKASLALFGASALLWLIACVNVASLMLARSSTRQREFAVRGALGASRWQILQQMLMETMLLSGGASIVGLGLSTGMLQLFEHGLQAQFSVHEKLTPNLPVFCALIGLTIAGALLIAVWPASGVFRASIDGALRQGPTQAGSNRKQHRTRAALVVTEIALSLTLLVGCGLLLRTIYALKHVPLGFRTEHILVANMTIPAYRFGGRDMTTIFYQPLIERVKRLPGVEGASLMTEVPLGNTFSMLFTLGPQGHSAIDLQRREIRAQFRAVGPEMQQVFGFRMLRGRFFNEGDTASSQAVVVVNRAFVKAYFGDDRDPSAILGESLVGFGKNRRSVVVGVLDDERQVSVAEPSQPEMEVSIPQITPESMFYKAAEGMAMDLAVRTVRDPSEVIRELRNVLRVSSSDLAESRFTTMEQVVEDSFGSQKMAAELLEIFAASALLLTVTGIYGVLAYFVAQRQREIGVRIALGAQHWNIVNLILRQASSMLMAGLLLGAALAYLTSEWLKVFLYGVKSDDPWTMVSVAVILLLGGLISSLVPAWRAASVNPAEIIRAE